jgi:hypothetical protein
MQTNRVSAYKQHISCVAWKWLKDSFFFLFASKKEKVFLRHGRGASILMAVQYTGVTFHKHDEMQVTRCLLEQRVLFTGSKWLYQIRGENRMKRSTLPDQCPAVRGVCSKRLTDS